MTGADLVLQSPSVGQWSPFYKRTFEDGQLDYFYDRSSVRKSAGHVVSRWKVNGSRGKTTTLHVLDISCRDGTFTEKGTVIFDRYGQANQVPQCERLVAHPIEKDTSSDVFRQMFCDSY